ncbi:MAG: hypothetical protein QOF56_1366 [Acidobacteriaceae bacterium]|nr:hypothetical protein [Acidobacteriaceae bacterium]
MKLAALNKKTEDETFCDNEPPLVEDERRLAIEFVYF